MTRPNPHLQKQGYTFIGFISKKDLPGAKKKLDLFGYKITTTPDKHHKDKSAAEWVEVYARKNARQIIRTLKEHFKSQYKREQEKAQGRGAKAVSTKPGWWQKRPGEYD